ncbi:hypothetical protein NSND_50591 [Nitrospira sp. ND1]|nr:hypothetical protein NSND_50591 [Nitrospira sp. ND1]
MLKMKRTEVIEDGNLLARTLTIQEPRQVPGAGKIVTLRAVGAQQCRSEAFWFRKILGPDARRQHPAHHLLHHLLHVPLVHYAMAFLVVHPHHPPSWASCRTQRHPSKTSLHH